jgi:hypothetical protein
MIFLIEYDRSKGRLVDITPFAERSAAEKARVELELKLNRDRVRHEVVLLEATDEKALRRTHRRYFYDLRHLAKSLT